MSTFNYTILLEGTVWPIYAESAIKFQRN